MRAAVLSAPGSAPILADVAEPVAGDGQVLVSVTAAAIAPIDRLIATGTSYLGEPPYPYTPGLNGTGVTEDGTHVWFMTGAGTGNNRSGSAAERVAVPSALTMPLSGRDDITAAALGGSAIAAVGALRRGGLAPGHTCIVLGAGGVVGQTALQFANRGGARVVAVVRGENARARALDLGAAAAVDSGSDDVDSIAAALQAECPDGADLVLDPLCGAPAAAALRVLVPGGRLVNLGDAAGQVLPIPSALLRSRSLQILGWTNQSLTWPEQCSILAEVLDLADQGRLVVDTTVVSLAEATRAWDQGPAGRLVLVP